MAVERSGRGAHGTPLLSLPPLLHTRKAILMSTDPILTDLAADRHPGVRDICRWLDSSHHTKPGRARDVARSFEAGAAGLLTMLPEDRAAIAASQDADS